MIEMAMADENSVSPLDVRRLEPERRIFAASVKIGVEQEDMATINELEVRVAHPTDYECVLVAGHLSAG
jgi:hypothetical protein